MTELTSVSCHTRDKSVTPQLYGGTETDEDPERGKLGEKGLNEKERKEGREGGKKRDRDR